MTRLVAGLRRTPKQFQSQTHTKKRSWSLFGGLLLIWSTTDLNPSEAIISEKYAQEIDEMQWKLQHSCIGQQKQPNSFPRQHSTAHHTTNTSKTEWIGLHNFASSAKFTWPLTSWLPLLQESWQLFAWKMFYIQQDAKKSFQEFVKSQNMDFYATGINKLIVGKSVLMNGSYFD